MEVVYDHKAIFDLQAIRDWINQDGASTAESVIDRIVRAAKGLERFPRRGRPGRHPATRELIVPGLPYVIIYEIRKGVGEIAVTSVIHMARDRSRIGL